MSTPFRDRVVRVFVPYGVRLQSLTMAYGYYDPDGPVSFEMNVGSTDGRPALMSTPFRDRVVRVFVPYGVRLQYLTMAYGYDPDGPVSFEMNVESKHEHAEAQDPFVGFPPGNTGSSVFLPLNTSSPPKQYPAGPPQDGLLQQITKNENSETPRDVRQAMIKTEEIHDRWEAM